jgi:oligoribonuclease NrnB/cAMP/cGMP phosphodiesterase (DHH superfamily)
MSKPILCIYHGNCADGFGAAWAVRHALGDQVEFHPGKYGETPPDVRDRHVLMVDFSYKRPDVDEMAVTAKSILILDHHKSAAEDLIHYVEPAGDWNDHIEEAEQAHSNHPHIPYIRAIFDMERSGAGLTWDYFHDETRPALIDHIEDRDLWRFDLVGTKEIQAAVFSYPYDFKVWDELMRTAEEELRADGEAISRKHMKDVQELIHSAASTMVIAGHEVPVLNTPYFYSSEAGHIMAKGKPFAACYWDTASGRTFSLRSANDGVDVSEIAKLFGGGGHRNAAGFRLSRDQVAARPFGPVAA